MSSPETPVGAHADPMEEAFRQAESAAAMGEIPVGAVVVEAATGAILAKAGNLVEQRADPTAHAEILVLRVAAAARGTSRLDDCDLYVTLEPCAMCAAAISFARIRRVLFGAYDLKGGGVDHGPRFFDQPTCHHRPEVVGGLQAKRAEEMLKGFFADLRT